MVDKKPPISPVVIPNFNGDWWGFLYFKANNTPKIDPKKKLISPTKNKRPMGFMRKEIKEIKTKIRIPEILFLSVAFSNKLEI